MAGAIVNGNIVPFDYELKDDDVVKINTNKNSIGPSHEWLKIAKTSGAKSKIRGFLNKIDKNNLLKIGQESLNKELRRKKISINDFLIPDNISKITSELKLNSLEDIYIGIGSNQFTPTQIINIINNDNLTKEEIIIKKSYSNKNIKPNKNDIIVKGIDDVKVNVASCCKPIPGDEIVGFITKGYGITIHKCDCPNIKDLDERLIDVYWNSEINQKYLTTILVRSMDNILLDIVAKSTNNDINIQSINSYTSEDNFLYELTINVINKEKLEYFIREIKSIKNILEVTRIIK